MGTLESYRNRVAHLAEFGEGILKENARKASAVYKNRMKPATPEPSAVTQPRWQLEIEAKLSMQMFDLVVGMMKTNELSRKYVYQLKEHGAEGLTDLKNEAARAVEIFEGNDPAKAQENSDGQLDETAMRKISGKLRGSDLTKMKLSIFGTTGNVNLGNERNSAIAEYLKDRKRNSKSAKMRENAGALLAEIGAI
jgi:CRISPR/Cas system CSM-associated protein Csm5 (group 7 of RAMP superfamily)